MSSATETPVPTIAGGFTIPTSPRRRLQNIQNNQASQPVAPLPTPSNDAQMSNQADEQVREQALTQVSNQSSEEVSAQSSKHGREQVSTRLSKSAGKGATTQVSKRGSNQGSGRANAQASAPADAETVEERVREMLAMKRTHPGGTKGSVDMDPDLMKRVKRYLLDNGDPSFRSLVIELVEAFLDKEGY